MLVLMIGMCPSLAITTAAFNGIGMGLATTFVLLGSNAVYYTHLDVYKRQAVLTHLPFHLHQLNLGKGIDV